jgi:LacI family transcriptional regulator
MAFPWRLMKRDIIVWAPVMREGTQGLQFARGIQRYALTDPAWRVNVTGTGLPAFLARFVRRNRPDGIVGCICSDELRRFVRGLRRPIVDLSAIFVGEPWPRVGVDDDAVGAMAAAHLAGLGVRHMAAAGPAGFSFSERRIRGFRAALCHTRMACSVLPCAGIGSWMARPDRRRLRAWLGGLSKPAGLFATTDVAAAACLRECSEAGIGVPDEIAVLGADNDELVCGACRPTLSSIVIPWDDMGYQAAGLLAAALRGEAQPAQPLLIPPSRVDERQSTDVAPTADPLIRRAVAVIRREAAGPLKVEGLASRLHVSRRTLERRFGAALGLTMAAEIRRVRIAHARRLLAETDLPVKLVASLSGFDSICHFTRLYRRATGTSPARSRSDRVHGPSI